MPSTAYPRSPRTKASDGCGKHLPQGRDVVNGDDSEERLRRLTAVGDQDRLKSLALRVKGFECVEAVVCSGLPAEERVILRILLELQDFADRLFLDKPDSRPKVVGKPARDGSRRQQPEALSCRTDRKLGERAIGHFANRDTDGVRQLAMLDRSGGEREKGLR